MNRQETGGVLSILSATWPRTELPDETAQVWASQLTRVLVEDALEASALLARSDEFFPTLHRFIDTCQAAARKRAADERSEGRELQSDNSPFVSSAAGNAWIRKVRHTIATNPPLSIPGFKTVGGSITEVIDT